ncbi:cytochrome B [Pandoraea anapnoica]|uniref:Cytochrome B n=1 Tax=Pandoraea anapnoica TaxID=2508301 RepID=A0A5E5AQF5_9BURK|nr:MULTISPECIES: cytochrome b [Pandoraea]VVE58332.1 cytochrome B [Pandoraea iniqua]VVE75247.1 cytochrome B [Pandoraea anapnoica]
MDDNLQFSRATRYSSLAVFFHWVVAMLVLLAYAAILINGEFPKGSVLRATAMALHEWLGTLVLIFAVPRLIWRLVKGGLQPLPGHSRCVHVMSAMTHFLLYAFIFAQPFLGYLAMNASGHTLSLSLLGINLPVVAGFDSEWAKSIKTVHETIGSAFYWVISLHAMAALWHHYFLRDSTLRRMLP